MLYDGKMNPFHFNFAGMLRFRATTVMMLGILLSLSVSLKGQIMQFGLKAGGQYSWVASDDRSFEEIATAHPIVGYNAGLVLSFKVKDRYFLHTEYLYSTKGKVNRGIVDKVLEDRDTYNYIEIPLLYNVHFR